jgi:hypothetical protein
MVVEEVISDQWLWMPDSETEERTYESFNGKPKAADFVKNPRKSRLRLAVKRVRRSIYA